MKVIKSNMVPNISIEHDEHLILLSQANKTTVDNVIIEREKIDELISYLKTLK